MVSFATLAEELDASDMLGHLRNFPLDLARAWKAAEGWDFSAIENQQYSGVICLGMGGSASGGDFLSCLSDADGCLPFVSYRGYDLPTWASEKCWFFQHHIRGTLRKQSMQLKRPSGWVVL